MVQSTPTPAPVTDYASNWHGGDAVNAANDALPVDQSNGPIQQVVTPTFTETPSYQPSGGGVSVREGVAIATSLLPIAALFASGGHKNKAPHRPVQIQRRQVSPQDGGMSEQTKLLLLGGGVLAVLGIGIFVLSK